MMLSGEIAFGMGIAILLTLLLPNAWVIGRIISECYHYTFD